MYDEHVFFPIRLLNINYYNVKEHINRAFIYSTSYNQLFLYFIIVRIAAEQFIHCSIATLYIQGYFK